MERYVVLRSSAGSGTTGRLEMNADENNDVPAMPFSRVAQCLFLRLLRRYGLGYAFASRCLREVARTCRLIDNNASGMNDGTITVTAVTGYRERTQHGFLWRVVGKTVIRGREIKTVPFFERKDSKTK